MFETENQLVRVREPTQFVWNEREGEDLAILVFKTLPRRQLNEK